MKDSIYTTHLQEKSRRAITAYTMLLVGTILLFVLQPIIASAYNGTGILNESTETEAPQKKVIGLEVTDIKKRAATLSWSPRKHATYYKLQIRQNGEVVHKWPHHVKRKRVIKRSHEILKANNTYWFRVKACNDAGCGPWSAKKQFTTLPKDSDDAPAASEYNGVEQSTYNIINDHRESLGLAPLTWSDGLADIAREHSTNMATGAVAFGHDGFDERFGRMLELTDGSATGGENVAYGCGYSEADLPHVIVDGWLNSEGHRENIERSSYTSSAIGVDEENGCYYFTQLFLTD